MNLQIFRSIAVLLLVFGLGACSPPAEKPRAGAPTGGDFVLQGPQGAVDSKALRGKLLLIYFGYVNCPDICPASLAVMKQQLYADAGVGLVETSEKAEKLMHDSMQRTDFIEGITAFFEKRPPNFPPMPGALQD